jgi:hypothetical protein
MHNARRHSGLSARARSRIRASRARLLFQLALATAGSGGVKIFEYEPGMIHAKIVIVDARYAIVGSTKFRQPGVVRRYGRWGTIIYWPTWLRFTFHVVCRFLHVICAWSMCEIPDQDQWL